MGKRRVGPPDRRRVAETFENPDHPMIDEIAGISRTDLDPGITWSEESLPTGRAIERVFARIVAAVSNRS